MADEWNDLWAGAAARGDQHMALLRDEGAAVLDFIRACEAFDAHLRDAGMERNARTTALVQTALAAGLTGEG